MAGYPFPQSPRSGGGMGRGAGPLHPPMEGRGWTGRVPPLMPGATVSATQPQQGPGMPGMGPGAQQRMPPLSWGANFFPPGMGQAEIDRIRAPMQNDPNYSSWLPNVVGQRGMADMTPGAGQMPMPMPQGGQQGPLPRGPAPQGGPGGFAPPGAQQGPPQGMPQGLTPQMLQMIMAAIMQRRRMQGGSGLLGGQTPPMLGLGGTT